MSDQPRPTASIARPGAALKALRRKHGWTLAEIGRRTGLPISTLSKIENDKMSLNYDKLVRISTGLQVDISALFSGNAGVDAPNGAGGRRSIARAGEGKAIKTPNYSHLYPAWDLLNKSLIPIVAELRARTIDEFGELIRHPGEEYAFVLEGEVDFYTSLYAPVRLKLGDSIYFDSGMGHAYVAASDGPCRVLSVCLAPEKHPLGGGAADALGHAGRAAPVASAGSVRPRTREPRLRAEQAGKSPARRKSRR
jgi:transcriptional regulator with XRE-family HTH domain